MLSVQELRIAASFLRQARALCEGVRDFFRSHDADTAARLGDIVARLDFEQNQVEQTIAQAAEGHR